MKNRKQNGVFGMAAVDLFAGAMGVFLILAMIALPYYLKVDKVYMQQVKTLTQVVIDLQNEIDRIKENLHKLDNELKKSKKIMAKQKQEIKSLKQQNKAQTIKIKTLQDKLQLQEMQLRECRQKRLNQQAELTSKTLELKKVKQELAQTKNNLSNVSKLTLSIKNELAKYKQLVSNMEYDVKALQYQNKKLEYKNQELENRDDNKIIQDLKTENEEIKRELLKTFCVVNISWDTLLIVDVDLHIEDPEGQIYYFGKRKYYNNDATFIVDSKHVRRGSEVWLTTELKQGVYKIYYHLYSGFGFVNVSGQVFTKSFTKEIPIIAVGTESLLTNDNEDKKILVAEIIVDQDGNATFILK